MAYRVDLPEDRDLFRRDYWPALRPLGPILT
jgi:hypothetical protein